MEHRGRRDPEPGSGLWAEIARPFPEAEEPLPALLRPGQHHLLLAQPGTAAQEEEEEEEEVPGGLAHLAQADNTYLGMSCCLRTTGLQAAPEPARGAFSYWARGSSAARQRKTVYALLQHQHCLRLARHYCRRLKAASDFVRRLMEAEWCLVTPAGRQSTDGGRLLRGLCQELRVHTSHWGCLQCHLRRDPRLRPLLLQQPEVLQRMKRSLQLLALQALCLLERCLDALLRHAAPGPSPLLSEAFRGLESYNQGLSEWGLQRAKPGPGAPGQEGLQAFSVERVLAVLAAERGCLAGERLSLLLPWQQAGTSDRRPTAAVASGVDKGHPAHLQALCREEEEAVTGLLPELLASTGGLRHRLLHRPKWDQPQGHPEAAQGLAHSALPRGKSPDWLDASFTEAATMLCAEYRPLFWKAASASWVRQLELQAHRAQFQRGAGAALGQRVTDALAEACLPAEAAEALKEGALCLLKRDALWQWDPGFCHALGASLVDRCLPKPTTVACSQTGQVLQSLFLLLAFSMRCLESQPFPGGPGQRQVPASLHLHLLSLAVATCRASSYWTMSKAYQYLASWSLGQFLLVAQGDLQLLKTEARKMLVLVSRAALEDGGKQGPVASHRERELSLQLHLAATSIQLFANDVLELFCADCRRVSAEVFRQAMPLGKYWRLALQAEPPSAASEYAQAAAQAILAPALQGVRWLPQDSQALVLSRVTTAALEAWMEHILAQKIKFSLQGALQLKRDFDLVRETLQSEKYELPAEVKKLVLSLRVFQQTDNAIACLLQQPHRGALSSLSWEALQKCCDGMRSWHGSPGSLSNLEQLEVRAGPESWAADVLSPIAPGGGTSSETYLSLAQQEWLALRLRGARPWKMPALSCMNSPSEA
ncbi:coiled-coil domain-containing protein 142 isoform X2 [Thamnophis elegans]|uniref:coiled-coil domain-containing protein 142 isoform X2 n=1 Tax=Thamnophis elegans TaxID=35005 RepID=UPI0013776D9F|nr:coiled-coil domain-containing protein 142 isoform X2 [Thamnophis elegans]